MKREEKIRYIKALSTGKLIPAKELNIGEWVRLKEDDYFLLISRSGINRCWSEYINTKTKQRAEIHDIVGYPSSESKLSDFFFLSEEQLKCFKKSSDMYRSGLSMDSFTISKKPTPDELAAFSLYRSESGTDKDDSIVMTKREFESKLKNLFKDTKEDSLEPLYLKPINYYFLNN